MMCCFSLVYNMKGVQHFLSSLVSNLKALVMKDQFITFHSSGCRNNNEASKHPIGKTLLMYNCGFLLFLI